MADEPRTFANTACPYCAVELHPPPKAKKRCLGCGQPIYVRLGPDGLTYLLQVGDLPMLDQAWAEYEYAAAGIFNVEHHAADDACPACRALHYRTFDPRSAPPIPVPGCEREGLPLRLPAARLSDDARPCDT
jgi:hypothetical protein